MSSVPVWFVAVIAIELHSPSGVSHVWPVALVEPWSSFQQFLVHIENKALLRGVDGKGFPGNGKELVSHSQNPAERQNSVRDLTMLQVNHQVLDFSQVFATRVYHIIALQGARG